MSSAVVSIIGHDRPGIVSEVSGIASNLNVNIDDTRATALGAEFAVLMGVSAPGDALAQLEEALVRFTDDAGMALIFRATESVPAPTRTVQVVVTSMDHPGIVHAVSEYFASVAASIIELDTRTQPAAHTGTPTFDLHMTVEVPHDMTGSELTESFADFCAAQGLDGTLNQEANL